MHIDTITITGIIANEPTFNTTDSGLAVFSARVAARTQKYDKQAQQWVPGDTNWYTVSAFRYLAANARDSLHKGDRIVATGRLRLRQWKTADKQGTTAEIDADAIGHDLTWGTSTFVNAFAAKAETGSSPAADAEPVTVRRTDASVSRQSEPTAAAFGEPTPF